MTINEYIRHVKNDGWQTYRGRLWQRNYYEHIIRNEESLHRIREYIANNPLQWAMDWEHPKARQTFAATGRPHRAAPQEMNHGASY